jgi:type I restriction enzyme, S subunit
MRELIFDPQWPKLVLHDLAEWVNGRSFTTGDFVPTGRPVVKIAEVKNGITQQTKFTEREFDTKHRVDPGDLLFSWSGNPETSIDAFWYAGPTGWLNQHVFRVTPTSGVDDTYFYYLLKGLKPLFTDIASNKQTTGLGHVTKRDLREISVGVPPLPEQKAIAHGLGMLDDKIELNRRMNETLEEMARAIFKSWFVDFDPVKAKMDGRKPYGMDDETAALFPDSFEGSEIGRIPKGWSADALERACLSVENGGTPKRQEPAYWLGGAIPWFKTGELVDSHLEVSEESITSEGLAASSCKLWPAGTVLIALYASPTVGRLGVLDRPATANQACSGLIPGATYGTYFLFYQLLSQRELLQRVAVGSAQQNISQGIVRSLRVLLPTGPLAAAFERTAAALHARMSHNLAENRTLADVRDALLPKLISGELDVRELTDLPIETR